MKNKGNKVEWLCWEPRNVIVNPWMVRVCVNDEIVAERYVRTIGELVNDAIMFLKTNPNGYAAVEMKSGSIIELSRDAATIFSEE